MKPRIVLIVASCCVAAGQSFQPSRPFRVLSSLITLFALRAKCMNFPCAKSPFKIFSHKSCPFGKLQCNGPLASKKEQDISDQASGSIQDSPTTQWWKHAALGAFLTTAAVLTPLEIDLSLPPSLLSSPPAALLSSSKAWALTEQQLLVTDVWKEVTRQYLDTTYNGMGEDKWREKRLDAVKKVTNLGPDDEEKVYESIRTMLGYLGDPYTRFLTPAQYETLTDYARGGSAGVGVQLQVDPRSGLVIVLNTVPNGPAEKGGILPGDAIVEVDGMDMATAPAEVVAAKCRGPIGTNVNVGVRHAGSTSRITQLTLERAAIKVNPVKSDVTTVNGRKLGIIQLASFSQETTKQVVEAMRQLEKEGNIKGIVLDLRGNAGGYMPAGVDVAKLFLPSRARIITEVDKADRQTIEIADGIGSEIFLPVYIIVDQRTASASEIMTAGLQDNGRAIVVGATKTFGKGRIQNVQEVGNGSGIAVTKAKYITPNGKDIHGVGITPNIKSDACGPENTVSDCLSSVI
jgi:carboxyl-terminal processing protease